MNYDDVSINLSKYSNVDILYKMNYRDKENKSESNFPIIRIYENKDSGKIKSSKGIYKINKIINESDFEKYTTTKIQFNPGSMSN